MEYNRGQILSNEAIEDGIYEMIVDLKHETKAGQFYMLKLDGATFLPRPISLCKNVNGQLTFVYATVGKGTKEWLNLHEGDSINVLGPLGNGFKTDNVKGKVALLAGGIGTAPMVELARVLKDKNKDLNIDFYGGFRENPYLINELEDYVDDIKISTNSGKHGHKGFVTELIDVEAYDIIYCCGPEVMMKRAIEMCKDKAVKLYVSMEKHMACGLGACLVCTCKTNNGNKRACKDGPVFDGNDVIL